MEVLSLQVFVSLMLGLGSLLLFAFTCRQRDFDHAERLALLPLDREGDSTSDTEASVAGADGAPRQGHVLPEEKSDG
jgi:cbb3-type cytochrome oxidase maturation protein